MSSDDGQQLVSCPVDDCDYGPFPRKSVLAHYSGKTDGLHPGGYQKAKQVVPEPGQASSQGAEPEPEPEPAPQQPPSSGSADQQPDRGSNPTLGSAEPVPDQEPPERRQQRQQQRERLEERQEQLDEAGDEPLCLRCGGEVYDFRAFDNGRWHRVNGVQVWVRGDYQCASCGFWMNETGGES